jgi:hypothetical protein
MKINIFIYLTYCHSNTFFLKNQHLLFALSYRHYVSILEQLILSHH